MNIILLSSADLISDNTVTLTDDRLVHINKVIRAQVGDRLRVGMLNGKIGHGIIRHLDTQQCRLDIVLDQTPPAATPITLVLALSRPKMMRRIYRMAAEYGLKDIYIINSYKTEKSFWQSPVVEQQSVRKYLLQGLQQSVDTVLPTVTFKKYFKPFVEDELAAIAAGKQALVAHPGNHPACPIAVKTPMILAIGPEGGFIPYEIEKLNQVGFQTVSLGPRILRVENAVSTLVARLFDGAC